MDRAEIGGTEKVSTAGGVPVGWVLASLSLCMLLPSLSLSIANVALPTLAAALDAPFEQLQWVVLAYLLTTTTSVVSAGRLGDLLGRRRVLLLGLGLFTIASGCCAVAPGPWMLIASRAAQGLGAAVLMSLTMAFVGDVVPKAQTGRAMGLLGTMSAVGTALGPSLGGLLIASFGWRAIFLVNLPLGVLALALAWRHLPIERRAVPRRIAFDLRGTLLLALTLAAYALSMTLGRGHFGPLNIGLLGAAALGASLFAWAQARTTSSLIPLAMLRDAGLRSGLATSALVSTVMMTTLVIGPFYLGQGLGLGVAQVGLALSIGPAVSAFSGVPAGRIVDRLGASRTVVTGLAGMAAGCLALSLLPTAWGVAGYIAPLVVLTASYALVQAANNTGVMADVAAERRGVVSGLLNLARNLGFITGAAVMGTLFAMTTGAADLATASAGQVALGMRVAFAVAAGLLGVAGGLAWASRRRYLPAVFRQRGGGSAGVR